MIVCVCKLHNICICIIYRDIYQTVDDLVFLDTATYCHHGAGNFSNKVLLVAKTVSPISPPAAAPPPALNAKPNHLEFRKIMKNPDIFFGGAHMTRKIIEHFDKGLDIIGYHGI